MKNEPIFAPGFKRCVFAAASYRYYVKVNTVTEGSFVQNNSSCSELSKLTSIEILLTNVPLP